jgi:hypothetical protein
MNEYVMKVRMVITGILVEKRKEGDAAHIYLPVVFNVK